MLSKPYLCGVAAALVLCSGETLLAQTSNRIAGVVRDETGAPIRGAIVRADLQGNAPMTLTAATDDRGRFIFVVLRSGDWLVAFEAPGFRVTTLPASVRLGGAAPNLDVKLERRENPEASGVMAGVDAKGLTSQLTAAAALIDEGSYDQAIAAYRDIKAKAPSLTLVNLQLGNAYLLKKSYPDAEAAFQEVLKSSADDANGLFAMGRVKEAEGNAAEARDWYQKASTADGYWTRPLMKLATLAGTSGDKAAANRYLAKVVDLDPTSADAIQAAALQKQLQ
jgi:tetratricopeptide (TPR) repeat protein